jgi:hypothetical protein
MRLTFAAFKIGFCGHPKNCLLQNSLCNEGLLWNFNETAWFQLMLRIEGTNPLLNSLTGMEKIAKNK